MEKRLSGIGSNADIVKTPFDTEETDQLIIPADDD
jgi:hypothetical protein